MAKITQAEIVNLVTDEENLKALRKKVRDLESKVANDRMAFVSRLDEGAKIEKGRYMLTVEEGDKRLSISWKDLYLSHQKDVHGIAPELAEEEARKLYPAEKYRALVIGINNI
jgi:hypothetical protein